MIDLLVLDVHGVVFNNPFRPFLRELAEQTGQRPVQLLERWDREIRTPAWTGDLDDEQLWTKLAGSSAQAASRDWRGLLESYYELGPAADHLKQWSACVPIWLLSNHRSQWLMLRLERFGLTSLFDRVLVSDNLRVAKPLALAFEPVLESNSDSRRVLFVDDQDRNVQSARKLGLQALQLTLDPSSLLIVDQLVIGTGRGSSTAPALDGSIEQ